jgi:hypothetical protein
MFLMAHVMRSMRWWSCRPTEMLKTPLFEAVGYNSSALIYLFFGVHAASRGPSSHS